MVSANIYVLRARFCRMDQRGTCRDHNRRDQRPEGFSLVEDKYIVDTTLDQGNKPGFPVTAKPVAIYLPETKWFDADFDLPWTGIIRLFPGATVRYVKSRRQKGWKSAPDFRPTRRKEIVARLIELNEWW
jgi:hypothetical protein